MSRWTCLFLIVLRLSIGWHFLFEGMHKIHSEYTKDAEGSKAFSSEGYFREARGPLGDQIRKVIGDPDKDLIAKLEIPNLPSIPDRGGKSSVEYLPTALAADMEAYRQLFLATYNLDESEKKQTENVRDQHKSLIAKWMTDEKSKVKRKSTASTEEAEFELTVQERVADLKKKLQLVEDVYDKLLPELGKDVEKATLRTKKADATAVRTGLQKDLDDMMAKYKSALAGIVAKDLTVVEFPKEANKLASFVLTSVTPEAGKMPTVLESQWDNWVAGVEKRVVKLPPNWKANAEDRLKAAKLRYLHYLADEDEHSGLKLAVPTLKPRIDRYRELTALVQTPGLAPSLVEQHNEELKRLAGSFIDDIRRHSDTLVYQAKGEPFAKELAKPEEVLLSDDLLNGTPVAEKEKTRVDRFDFATRYGLSLIGALLLVGLFTRIGALMGVGFLLMTNLLHPSLPWLPASPMNEGNYVFVNKNMIEMFALLVIATTRSGRWFGLDALIHRIVFGSGAKRPAKPVAVAKKK